MRFQTKITLCITLLIAVAFGVGNCILLDRSFESALARERSAAYYTYHMLLYSLDAVDAPGGAVSYADMHNTIYQLDAQGGGWAALRLKSGDMILYSSPDHRVFNRTLQEQTELNQCSTGIFRQEDTWYLQVTGRFSCGGVPFTLDALYDLGDDYRTRETQLRDYRVAYAAVVVFSAAMSWVLSRWITGPLRELSRVLRKITAGDLSCRARITTHDEVGDLARDLNHMTGQLEQNMEEMRQAMQRQEQFMGSFVHELKTPMTAIIGYADLLRSQTLSPEEQQSAANYIFNEGRRLEQLSLKLLELFVSRKGDFELLHCRPRALLKEVAGTVGPSLAREGIEFRYECGPGVCRLEPDLVRTLLTNLIDNARKAMDQPGCIRVRGEVTREGCRFTVQDNGRGIAAEELAHISEPFYRVDKSRSRAQGGAGLGLALCSEIVRLHKGEMSFSSAVGQGTCVTVELRGGAVCVSCDA